METLQRAEENLPKNIEAIELKDLSGVADTTRQAQKTSRPHSRPLMIRKFTSRGSHRPEENWPEFGRP